MTTTIRSVGTRQAGMAQASASQLLRRARLELDVAHESSDAAMAFLHAHMAAIRAASAVLSLAPPRARRRRMLSVWEQLAEAGPEWEGWAAQFAAGAPIRAAIDAGRVDQLDHAIASATTAAAAELIEHVAVFAQGERAPAAAALAS